MAQELDKFLNKSISTRKELMRHLKEDTKVFENKDVEKAFEAVDRKDFVTEDCGVECYEDYALPIGYGQTISQPTTVAFMLELLSPKKGNVVLDVGSGSGFTLALMSYMVGTGGKVTGTEIVPALIEFAKRNLSKYKLDNIKIFKTEKEIGHKEGAPYDRILVSAASTKIPEELLSQLKVGGVMVIPVNNSIFKVTKRNKDEFDKEEYPGFIFVPLIKDDRKEN